MQTDEFRAAHLPNYTVLGWVDFPDAHYREIDGDKGIATGLKILSTPGHTPGHQALQIDTNAGSIILAGQAIYSKTEYDYIREVGELIPEDAQEDPERYLASAQRIIALDARRVFFSHDVSVWQREG